MSKVQLVQPDEEFEVQIDDSYFTLARVPADETTKMLRRHTKKRPGGQEEVDSLTFNREYRDRAIRSWREVDGDPPCTIDTKMRLPDSTWRQIQEYIGESNIDELRAKETSLKN